MSSVQSAATIANTPSGCWAVHRPRSPRSGEGLGRRPMVTPSHRNPFCHLGSSRLSVVCAPQSPAAPVAALGHKTLPPAPQTPAAALEDEPPNHGLQTPGPKRLLKKKIYGRTKPGTLLKHHIPLKTDHWDVTTPGFTGNRGTSLKARQ